MKMAESEENGMADKQMSDCLADETQVQCALCEFVSSRLQFYKHFRSDHKDIVSTVSTYSFFRLTYHQCKLCHVVIMFDQSTLSDHIRKKHLDYTWKEYKSCYLTQDPNNKEKKVGEESSGVKCLSSDVDPVDVTNDVHEMCLARCLLCDEILLLHHMQYHLYDSHEINLLENTRKQRFQIVRQTYIRCRLCWKLLLFSYHSLFLHLRAEHYISLKQYKQMYMGYQKGQYLYQRPVPFVRSDKGRQNTSALTEMSAADTGDGNIDSGVILEMVVESEPGDDMQPIKMEEEEEKDVKILNGSVKLETGQPDETFNPPVSKTMIGAGSSNSYNANNDDSDPEQEVEEDYLGGGYILGEDRYKCPIRGCRVRMVLAGLKNGAAAKHVVEKHKMRLYTMRKLNLKWQKVVKSRLK